MGRQTRGGATRKGHGGNPKRNAGGNAGQAALDRLAAQLQRQREAARAADPPAKQAPMRGDGRA
jgi:hypothetical protein